MVIVSEEDKGVDKKWQGDETSDPPIAGSSCLVLSEWDRGALTGFPCGIALASKRFPAGAEISHMAPTVRKAHRAFQFLVILV